MNQEINHEPAPSLPAYPGIAIQNVTLVLHDALAEQVCEQLMSVSVLGFDTETRPVFQKGQRHNGPHLIQLATEQQVFLFPVQGPALSERQHAVLKRILEAHHVLKAGFGLSDDLKSLKDKLGILTAPVLDLAKALRENKHADMGAKTAVAKFFGMQLSKSKKISTSNWAQHPLTEKQILYAANDAHVALLVYQHWQQRLELPHVVNAGKHAHGRMQSGIPEKVDIP